MARRHLVIDADDTLWENNIYFEAAFSRFRRLLNHSRMTAGEVRAALDVIELESIKIHGDGAVNFARNLRCCLERLAERSVTEAELQAAEALALDILEHPIQLLPGVAATLAQLAHHHQLILFTKGSCSERQAKLDRSGIAHYFDHVVIVKEKDAAAYRALAENLQFALRETWMVGNSPKSDINPALEVGRNAACVPHPHT